MVTVNELFAGIGSQAAALERLGIDYKVVGIAEIDKYAIKSYEAIHGHVRNYGDISKIEKLDYADFWTYSFPCQDISVAGKQRGINENTRSGLLYEVERLLYRSVMYGEQPKWLMLENVKNLVGKQFKPQFEEWIKRLDELEYNTYWKVLNAKNYGIPQNRERVLAISIRKDIDTGYEFPIGFDNGKRLKDILESEVDEKYYLNGSKAMMLIEKLKDDGQLNNPIETVDGGIKEPKAKDIANCIKARYDCGISNQRSDGTMVVENICQQVADLNHYRNDQMNRVYGIEGISPTITVVSGGGREQKVLIPQATKQGYIECNIPGVADLSFPDSKTRRGRVQENGEICPTLMSGAQDICYIDTPCIAASRGRNPQNPSDRTVGSPTEQRLEINKNGTSNTITTVQKDNYVLEPQVLTPKRTEYGKSIRKAYENGLVDESRHNMTELLPRNDGVSNTLTTVQKDNYVIEPQTIKIGNTTPSGKSQCNDVYSAEGIHPTLCAGTHGNCNPSILEEPNKIATLGNIYPSNGQAGVIYDIKGISPTVRSNGEGGMQMPKIVESFRIRKLTPLECWRLMGFTDDQFRKAEQVNSNSQLYKQAGNSIVVDVLYYLFKNLFGKN